MATLMLDIPDELLERTGLTAQEARIELACRMFDAERLNLAEAERLSGLPRLDFEQALIERNLSTVHYTEEMAEEDIRHARGASTGVNGEKL